MPRRRKVCAQQRASAAFPRRRTMSLMTASMIINGINILLVCGLLSVYVRNAVRVPSAFTAGLLIFAALFLMQNIMSFTFAITMMPYFAQGLDGYVLAFNALEMLAFLALGWVTWK